MPSKTNSGIDLPAIAQKIRSKFPNTETLGTGFVVNYRDQDWLFTCWHNIGPTKPSKVDLTGEMTATEVRFVNPASASLGLLDRRVVGARINGEHADIAAIELKQGERPQMPAFSADQDMSRTGPSLPKEFFVGGHGGEEQIKVPIVQHYLWQGFPGTNENALPESFTAVDFIGLTSHHPWMLRCAPGGYKGASGCPVLEVEEKSMRLAGIQVHINSGMVDLNGQSSIDGRSITAKAELDWGTAVPIKLLYQAIDNAADSGISISDIIP